MIAYSLAYNYTEIKQFLKFLKFARKPNVSETRINVKSLPSNGILFKLRLCSFKDILCVLVPRGFTDLNNSELFDGFKPEFAFRYTQLDNKVS